jgi:hypothetical protein
MSKLAGNPQECNPDTPLEPSPIMGRIEDLNRFVNLCYALDHLEGSTTHNRVTIEAYKDLQAQAVQLFAGLFKPLPPAVAREAQSAISNALFSLDLSTPENTSASARGG